jgi:hypothetical protein
METAPMMGQDPMMGAEAPAEAQSFEVCISPLPDGTFRVTKEAKEMTEEPTEEPEQAGDVAQTIDEALELARQLLQDTGEGTPEDQVMQGYNKGMAPAKPKPAQVFGE